MEKPSRRGFLTIMFGGAIGSVGAMSYDFGASLALQRLQETKLGRYLSQFVTRIDPEILVQIANDFDQAHHRAGYCAAAASGLTTHAILQARYFQDGLDDKQYQMYLVPFLNNGTFIDGISQEFLKEDYLSSAFHSSLMNSYALDRLSAEILQAGLYNYFSRDFETQYVLLPTLFVSVLSNKLEEAFTPDQPKPANPWDS